MVIPNGRPDPKNGIINHWENRRIHHIHHCHHCYLSMNAWNEFKIVWVGQIVRLDFCFCAFDFIDCINFDQRVCSMFCQKWHNLLPLQLFEKAKKCTWYNYLLDFIWLGSVCMPPFLLSCHVPYILKGKVERRKVGIWAVFYNSWHLANVEKFIIS